GATVIARDINPVAVLTTRQALARWSEAALRRHFATVQHRVQAKIDALYVTAHSEPVLQFFWVAVAQCPDCNDDVELFTNYVFAKHAYPERFPLAQATCPSCHSVCPVNLSVDTNGSCAACGAFALKGPVAGRVMTCSQGHRN